MRRLPFIIFMLMLPIVAASAYKQQSINIDVNGQSRNMVVYTPTVLPDNVPLMIVTHGMNQSPEYQYDGDKLYEMIDTAKFVVAYLRSDGNTWDTGGTKDQNFVLKTIDEMQARFNIDTNRVYWSGFSMGSMLIFHCIAQVQDRIAAFAPTSGIQFSESPWNNCKKAVNLIEITSYKDEVFGYEQYGMHAYIENFAKHDQHTTYTKTPNYRPSPDCYYTGDLEQWSGGPNGGEVWMFSGSEGGHWPSSYNRLLIWNFCKRFSLDPGIPTIKITAPQTTDVYTSLDTIAVRATISDADGTIRQVRIYIDGVLKSGKTNINEAEYEFEYEWIRPRVGSHTIRVMAIDNEGKTKDALRTITIVDIAPYRAAFEDAWNAAQALTALSEDSTYATATDLLDALQQVVGQYTGFTSTSLTAYEAATAALTDATTKMQTRKENLDSYFALHHTVDSIIALYADDPTVSALPQYERLVKAKEHYTLSEALMQQDSRLQTAAKQLGIYVNLFNNATVGIALVGTDRAAVISEQYYTIDGQPTTTPKGIVIRRTRLADGTVRTVKVLCR